MESITAASDEILIDALSFKVPGTGNYIQERRSVTFQTEGSNTYAPDQWTRVMRFRLATEGWLDPSTVRIFLDVINNDQSASGQIDPWPTTKVIRPIGPVHTFFKRLRITMRGVVIEDIMDFNRVSEMFDICTPAANRANTRAEGFGNNWDEKLESPATLKGIAKMQTVCFKPLCGILLSPYDIVP